MKVALVVLWLCVPPGAWAQADSLATPADSAAARPEPAVAPDAVTTVRALEAARQGAMVSADTKRLADIMAPDFTMVHSNGLAQSRAELFAMLERGEIRYVSIQPEDPRYRVFDGTVIGTGVQSLEVRSGGKSTVMRSRYTVVYVNTPAGWRLAAYQSTLLPKMGSRP
jgi:ketosteroid isomerase-like protein